MKAAPDRILCLSQAVVASLGVPMAEVFLASDLLCTDDVDQFRHFKRSGLFGALPEDLCELADIVAGKAPGRRAETDIITAINIGIALEDMAVASLVYRRAVEGGTGTWLER